MKAALWEANNIASMYPQVVYGFNPLTNFTISGMTFNDRVRFNSLIKLTPQKRIKFYTKYGKLV